MNVITPNKKAFSGDAALYDQILQAALESGAKFLNESTVGAGLPIISTLKDLVATGDKVSTRTSLRFVLFSRMCDCRSRRLKVYSLAR